MYPSCAATTVDPAGTRGTGGSAAGGTVHGVYTGTGAAARLIINAPSPAIPACCSTGDTWCIQWCNRNTPVAALHPHAHPHDIPSRRAGDHGGTTKGTIIHNGLAGRTGVGIYTEPVTTTDTAYCEGPADHLEIQEHRFFIGWNHRFRLIPFMISTRLRIRVGHPPAKPGLPAPQDPPLSDQPRPPTTAAGSRA